MKLCKDCRFIEPHPSGHPDLAVCGHKMAEWVRTNPVDGSVTRQKASCTHMRMLGECGEDGILWMPKGPVGFV